MTSMKYCTIYSNNYLKPQTAEVRFCKISWNLWHIPVQCVCPKKCQFINYDSLHQNSHTVINIQWFWKPKRSFQLNPQLIELLHLRSRKSNFIWYLLRLIHLVHTIETFEILKRCFLYFIFSRLTSRWRLHQKFEETNLMMTFA